MTGITVAAAASRRGMILTSRRHHFACLRHCGICMNPTSSSSGIGLNDNSNYYRSGSSIPLNCYTWSRTNSTTTKSNRKMKKNTNFGGTMIPTTIDISSLSTNGGGALSGHVRSDLSGSLSGGGSNNGNGSGGNHGSKNNRKSNKRSQNNNNNNQNSNNQHSQNSSSSNKVKVIYKSQKDDDAQQQKPKVRGGENMRRKRPNRRSAAVLSQDSEEDDKNNAESQQQQSQHFLQQTGNFGTIKDSSHVPILIPPSNNNNDDKDYKFNKFKNLPIMNASALLDPEYVKKYSVKGTRSRNGTDAARRLLHAKKDFVNMLRGYIVLQEEHYTNPNLSYNNNKNRNPVCLTGHGVPKALLQDHINMADSLLKFHDEPVGCFFKNTVFMHHIQHAYYDYNNSSSSEQQQQKKKDRPKQPRKTIGFNRMRIVKHNQPTPHNNNNNNNNKYNTSTWWSWPPKTTTKNTDETTITHPSPQLAQSWERQMELYLTVMDRMITRLSLGLQQYNHNYNNNNHQQHKKPTYYYWTVKIIRGITYPIEYLSDASSSNNNNDYDEPIPLVEWTIPSSSYRTSIVASKSSNKHHRQQHQGHISIRLQGIPDDIYNDDDLSDVDAANKQQQQPVTLLFDAYFGS